MAGKAEAMKPDRIIRELKGDLPDELIATGAWLDALGAERKLLRSVGESDSDYRTRLLERRLSEQIQTDLISVLQLDRKS